jgi:siroheme synthase (precorrin-2 oxidase/ferrochelatase)
VGGGRSKVESHEDSEEVVLARRIRRDLSSYFERSTDGMKRLALVANHPKVAELAAEHRVLRRRWREERGADRRVFDRMSEMRSGTAATEVARRAFGVPERARRAARPALP